MTLYERTTAILQCCYHTNYASVKLRSLISADVNIIVHALMLASSAPENEMLESSQTHKIS
jgi:hypothetical protein